MPFTPTSNITILPIDVPIAKNLFPLDEIHVGIPTPFDYDLFMSNSYVTFFRAMYTMLRIFYGEGKGREESLAHLWTGFDSDIAKFIHIYIEILKATILKL